MIQITTKKDEYITVTAPVLVPGEPDCDFQRGETPLTREQIKEIAHSYMDYRIIDKEHDYFQTKKEVGTPVESYITTKNETVEGLDGQTRTYPPGTWFITVKITDNKTMEKVLNGEYTGVSVTAVPRKRAEKISTKESQGELIKDLDDPVGYTVSLVSVPCVKSARFCKADKKDDGEYMTNNEDQGIVQAIKEALGMEHEQSTKSETETMNENENVLNDLENDLMEEAEDYDDKFREER